MSKGGATTTTSTAPNPVAGQAYDQLIQQAGQVAATPYQAYTGELTAPINQQQQQGVGTINQYATAAVPYLQGAESTIQGAAQPLTQAQIQQYQSPYTQDVVNATEAQFNNQNAQQQQQVLGNAAAQGALGGDRTAVAQSVLAGQQQAQEAPVIAGLENQGYTQALQTAGQQFQQNPEQAAYGMASTGTALENAGLTGANAQFGAGTAEQQTQQAQDTAAYQQYEQALQYPFATLGWEAGIDTGVGSQLGGTSSTTAPPPNYTAQLIGAGIGTGAAVLSDKRAKENLKKVGKLHDGQSVYRFNYKGDPTTRIGLVAQEVERDHPEAVHQTNGWKSVDYDAATKDAVRRLLGGRVQGLATGGSPYDGSGGMPYSAGVGYVPTMSISKGSGAPKPPGAPNQQQQNLVQSPQQMATNAAKIAGSPGVSSGLGSLFGSSPTYGGGDILAGDVSGGSSASPLAGLDASDYGVGFKEGGRIYMKRGGAPVRAGLGMASFMPRRHFDSGGSATDDDTVSFDDRWNKPPVPAGLYNNSSGDANPLENILKFQTYGQASPYAPPAGVGETPRASADDELPPQIMGGSPSAPQAGVGSALSFADDGSRNAAPVAPPDSVNAAPAAAAPAAAPADKKGFGLLGLLSPDVGMSALSAGLGMMASRSPFLGSAIGEGGLQGLSTYSDLQKQHVAQADKQQDLDLKVKQLNQAAKAEQDRIALETKKESDTYSKMTPAQQAEVDFRNRNLERENLQPVKVGTDMSTGTDIYAVRDPTAPGGFRRIDPSSYGAPRGTPQGTGAPVSSAEPTTTPPAVPSSDDASLPAHSTPVSGDVPDNVKPEILAALDPNVASQVKALDEGRMAFPTGFALSKPYWQNMLRLVSNYDPSFDAVNYNARAKTRSDFVAGKSAQNITSFNTAIGHLDSLDNSIDALGNTRFGWLNPMLQSAKSAMGDPQFQAAQKDFMAKKQAVTDELTRAFRGSGGNVHDIVGWENTLSQADSPTALHAATKAAIELLRSRIESVGDQYNRGMGTTRDPLTMLSPRAQAAVARLSGEAPAQSAAPAVDPRDAAALKANASNPAAAAAIDRKYGTGTAARLLGAQ